MGNVTASQLALASISAILALITGALLYLFGVYIRRREDQATNQLRYKQWIEKRVRKLEDKAGLSPADFDMDRRSQS